MRQSVRSRGGFVKGHKHSPNKGSRKSKKGIKLGPREIKPNSRPKTTMKNQNSTTHIPKHRHRPEGTQEQMTEAYNQARGYQLVVLDYSDKDEIPKEVLDQQRRIFHFAKNGPNYNKFIAYGESKVLYADVLYILSCKVPSKRLAEIFNVSRQLILKIRAGQAAEWQEEYELVKRIKRALYGRYKKNFTETHITSLLDGKGITIQHFSSIKKAREYRKHWLIYNQNMEREIVESMIKDKSIEKSYPIKETTVIS